MISEQSVEHLIVAIFCACGVALLSNVLVLVFALIVYRNPVTRVTLKRQSLRLLLWGQSISLLTGLLFLLLANVQPSAVSCSAATFFMVAGFLFVGMVTMFIAVNLYLTVVHAQATTGYAKWYLLISGLFATSLSVVPAAAGLWTHDPQYSHCVLSLRGWEIAASWQATASHIGGFLTAAAAAIALLCTISVVVHLLLARVRVRAAIGTQVENTETDDFSVTHLVLRIIPYPLVLILWSVIALWAVLCLTGVVKMPPVALAYAMWVIVPSMPLVLAIMAVSIDPCFPIAIRIAAFGGHIPPSNTHDIVTVGSSQHKPKMATSPLMSTFLPSPTFPSSPISARNPFHMRPLSFVLLHDSLRPVAASAPAFTTLADVASDDSHSSDTANSVDPFKPLTYPSPAFARDFSYLNPPRGHQSLDFKMTLKGPIIPLSVKVPSPRTSQPAPCHRGSLRQSLRDSQLLSIRSLPLSPVALRIRNRSGTISSVSMNNL